MLQQLQVGSEIDWSKSLGKRDFLSGKTGLIP